jgi:hypothetical protein
VVLKCKKIQKCMLPCENFNFVKKISRYFAKFRNISRFAKFREIKKLFREIRKKYFAKFRDREISSTTLVCIFAYFLAKMSLFRRAHCLGISAILCPLTKHGIKYLINEILWGAPKSRKKRKYFTC